MREVVGRLRNIFGLDKEIVWFVFGEQFPCARKVDHTVHDDVRDVDVLGAEAARHGLGQ